MSSAAAAKIFMEMYFPVFNSENANKENISTDRTTEGESPVTKANPQRVVKIMAIRKILTLTVLKGILF
jgi:hypothetical protein